MNRLNPRKLIITDDTWKSDAHQYSPVSRQWLEKMDAKVRCRIEQRGAL